MNALPILLAAAGAVALGALVVVLVRARRRGNQGSPSTTAARRPSPDIAGHVVIVLDVPVPDPALPAARRLVDREVAPHLADPAVRAVEVRDADGRVVAVRHPPHEPDLQAPAAAQPVEPGSGDAAEPPCDPAVALVASAELGPVAAGPQRTVADRLDLPDEVSELLDADPSVGEVLEAMLGASGTSYARRDGAFVVGEVAVVPIESTGTVSDAQLNQAYLRFDATGARRGLALTGGHLPHQELRRRHALAPQLRHGGLDTLQRLADEVALQGDLAAALRELATAARAEVVR